MSDKEIKLKMEYFVKPATRLSLDFIYRLSGPGLSMTQWADGKIPHYLTKIYDVSIDQQLKFFAIDRAQMLLKKWFDLRQVELEECEIVRKVGKETDILATRQNDHDESSDHLAKIEARVKDWSIVGIGTYMSTMTFKDGNPRMDCKWLISKIRELDKGNKP